MAAQYDDEIVQALVAARAVIRRMGYQATDSAMISDLRLAFRVLDDAGLFSQLDRQIQYPRLESASDSKSSSKGSV